MSFKRRQAGAMGTIEGVFFVNTVARTGTCNSTGQMVCQAKTKRARNETASSSYILRVSNAMNGGGNIRPKTKAPKYFKCWVTGRELTSNKKPIAKKQTIAEICVCGVNE